MSEINGTVFSYLGFAKKAGKLKAGVNAISTLRGAIPLMILCDSASDNTKKEAAALSKKHGSKLYLSKEVTVEKLVNKENCKLVAVLDDSLAKAIINAINSLKNDQFVFLEA